MTRVDRMRFLVAAVAFASLAGSSRVRAAVDPAIERGVQFLRPRAGGQQVGEAALIALALIKAEATAERPDRLDLHGEDPRTVRRGFL